MSTHTVTIQIDPSDMKTLKDAGYKLCIACRLQDEDGDVVWYASGEYTPVNRIELTDEYRIFASQSFSPKEQVSMDIAPVFAAQGEECVLNEYGSISSSKTGENPDAIVMINQYAPIHPGICCKGKGLKGEDFSNPFFLSQHPVVLGYFEFFPCFKVRIWFSQDLVTAMAFIPPLPPRSRAAQSKDIRIDLTQRMSPRILYHDGKWDFI